MVQPFLPNEADAFHDNQAEPDSVDFEILLLGYQRTGVLSGCLVAEDPVTPDLTVDVPVGTVLLDGSQIAVSEQLGNAVTTGAGSPRIDLVTINSSGTVVITDGTAAAQPVAPAIPADSVPLAFLYVPASDTSIANEQINDKRVLVADRYVVNVKNFGATGDGTTDDTAAIQAAIDAVEVSGGIVFFPSGSYLISAFLTVQAPDVVLRGAGGRLSTIKLADTTDTNLVELNHLADRCIVEHLAFDGNKANNTLGTALWLNAPAASSVLSDVIFRNCTIFDCSERAIHSGEGGTTNLDVENLLVENCIISGTEAHAIFLNWHTPNARIINNHIKDTSLATANGIWAGNGADNLIIAGNRIENTGDMGIEVTEPTTAADRALIQGNQIFNAGNIGISLGATDNAVCDGNVIDGAVSAGIEAAAANLSITGNVVRNVTGATGRPISISNTGNSCVITGNTFEDCSSGLQVFESEPGVIIANNIFRNVGDGGPGDGEGDGRSLFINEVPYVVVAHNTFSTVSGDAAKHFPIYFTGGAVPCFIHGNFVNNPDGIYSTGMFNILGSHFIGDNWEYDGTDLIPRNNLPRAVDVAAAITLAGEKIVNMDTAAAGRTVTLPDAADYNGKSYLIRRDGANTVTINRAGTDTFDDADIQKTLDSDGAAIGIFSIGDGEWKIVGIEGTVGGS